MKVSVAALLALMIAQPVLASSRKHGLLSGFGSSHYTNERGRSVKSPKRTLFGFGSSAKCRDGASSFSRNSSGSCSGHGGVSRFH